MMQLYALVPSLGKSSGLAVMTLTTPNCLKRPVSFTIWLFRQNYQKTKETP